MAEFSPTSNFLNYLNSIKDSAAYARAVDAWNASKAYLSSFGDGVEALGDARDTSDLRRRPSQKVSVNQSTVTSTPSSKYAGTKAYNAGVKAGQVKFCKSLTIVEHAKHRLNIASVQVGQVNSFKGLTCIEQACHVFYVAGV